MVRCDGGGTRGILHLTPRAEFVAIHRCRRTPVDLDTRIDPTHLADASLIRYGWSERDRRRWWWVDDWRGGPSAQPALIRAVGAAATRLLSIVLVVGASRIVDVKPCARDGDGGAFDILNLPVAIIDARAQGEARRLTVRPACAEGAAAISLRGLAARILNPAPR